MESAIEIVLLVIIAPFLEWLLTAVIGAIIAKWKWHPLKNQFDKTIANTSVNSFVMIVDAATKATQIVAVVFATLGYICAILLPILLFVSKQVTIVGTIFCALIFQAIILPLFLLSIHSITKKIYFSEKYILVKSFIYFKKVSFSQIVTVTETAYNPAIPMLLIRYNQRKREKKIKIAKTFGNYDLAKKRLIIE